VGAERLFVAGRVETTSGYCGVLVVLEGTTPRMVAKASDASIYGIVPIWGGYAVSVISHDTTKGLNRIVRLASDLTVMDNVILPDDANPHGMYESEGELVVIATGLDILYGVTRDLKVYIRERFGLGSNRRLHRNDSVVFTGGRIYTQFTTQADGLWDMDCIHKNRTGDKAQGVATIGSEVVMDDLMKPHSPVLVGDMLYVCDSGRGAVRSEQGRVFMEPATWTRGMCFHQGLLHVGVADEAMLKPAEVVSMLPTGEIIRRVSVPLHSIYSVEVV